MRESRHVEDETMHRITVAEADRDFAALVNRVSSEGISVELERDDKVVARLMPAAPQSRLKVGDFNAFLRGLPTLGNDSEAFESDLREIRRSFGAETIPWD
jgi:antitoxin (DNA-binding transcriptional repressor) of toxin-antitoxin stability system